MAWLLFCLVVVATALTLLVVPDGEARCRFAVTRGPSYAADESHPCDSGPLRQSAMTIAVAIKIGQYDD